MSTLSPEDLFAEPPGPDLLKEPKHRLVGRLPDPDSAASAMAELANAGFRTNEIYVISGDEGIRRIDPEGVHHGLRGRVVRGVEYLAYGELIAEDEAHLEAGGVIMTVPARDPAGRERAEKVLRANGASRMRYWGEWTWEEII